MAKIGIGVTTYNRPERLKECLRYIEKHTFLDNVTLYVATDTDEDRKGVAFRKNECLRALKDCDYVFLFDDDCFPIKDGWIEFFINTKENHLLLLDSRSHTNIKDFGQTIEGLNENIEAHLDCGGVFMFMTKDCIDKVGAFNEKFSIWGFEHAEYSWRIHEAGLTKHHYLHAKESEQYIYSHDYSTLNHKSSISNEEKQKYFNINRPKFSEPIKDIYIPL